MEQRYQAVMAVQVEGLEVTVVAEKFGVSRQTMMCGCVVMSRAGWMRWRIVRIGRRRVRIRCPRSWRHACASCGGSIRIGGRRGSRTGSPATGSIPSRRRWASIGPWFVMDCSIRRRDGNGCAISSGGSGAGRWSCGSSTWSVGSACRWQRMQAGDRHRRPFPVRGQRRGGDTRRARAVCGALRRGDAPHGACPTRS